MAEDAPPNSPDKIDRRVKYRVDQVIRQLALDRRLGRKLRTILKPIGFSGGWLEYFLVGRYGRGGHFSAHRDDIFTVIEDRKWSLVCPLNEPEDYRGGILVFPELKISLRPKAGTAIIFSAHLLHGLMPVRSGHRFVLTTFARKN